MSAFRSEVAPRRIASSRRRTWWPVRSARARPSPATNQDWRVFQASVVPAAALDG
jgi:hypothetical protein